MGKIAEISNAILKTFQGAPGKSISVNIEHHGTDDAEFYQLPGFHCKPHDGAQCVVLSCNQNNIVVASHDYKFNENIETGETLLYSYDSNGVLKGKILIDKDGLINIVNDATDLKTELHGLITELKTLIGHIKGIITTGSPVSHTVSAASKAVLDGDISALTNRSNSIAELLK